MPRRRGRGSEHGLSAEINVTSLVDVALTLLVIFLITAPILQGGVEVNVPRAEAASMAEPEGVMVTMTRDERLFIGDAQVPWEQFAPALTDVMSKQQSRNIYLKADEAVPYGRVLRVLGAMKGLELGTVGLVAEPEGTAQRGGG
jgi:biopolymer transport protein ExbD/biopolymer transport protein TolR